MNLTHTEKGWNESGMKTECFQLPTRRKMNYISTSKDREIEGNTLKTLNQKVVHAISTSVYWLLNFEPIGFILQVLDITVPIKMIL